MRILIHILNESEFKNVKELIKYGLCGGLTTAANLFLFYMFTETGVYYIVSNIISYYIAVVLNFLLNDFLCLIICIKKKEHYK